MEMKPTDKEWKDRLRADLSWDIMRSQLMSQVRITIPREQRRDIMIKVIEAGVIQFVEDAQPLGKMTKLHVMEMQYCAECDRKLRVLIHSVNEYLEDDDENLSRAAKVFEPYDVPPPPPPGLEQLSSRLTQVTGWYYPML